MASKTAAAVLVNVALVILTAASAAVLSAYLVRRVYSRSPSGPQAVVTRRIANWRRLAQSGQRVGPSEAPVTINEFTDFQCPFCGQLALDLARVRTERPQEVSIVFHHYPIQALHPHARAAAAAAVCAGLQGRFEALQGLLFAHQPDIGSVPWPQFARAAGVEDTSRFSRCLVDPATERRVRRDIQLGNELGLQGTPTVLINDMLVAGAVPLPVLDSLIRLALERSRPVLE